MPDRTIKILVEQATTGGGKVASDVKKTLKEIETEAKASNKRIGDAEKQKSKEVLAIEAETVKNKRENQKQLESALRSRIEGELKLEKELARSRKQIANDFIKDFQKQQSQLKQSNFGSDLFQGTFLGSLFGATAGGAVSQILGAVTSALGSLLSTAKDLGSRILQTGSDFERTVNAMRVFTGSTNLAKKELAEIDKVARDTNGLRLEDAETGATRLRGLSFDLQTTKDLIVGISKEKLINNSDEAEINRVITNLAQLKAGSPQARRDIQQMVLAMPHLSLVIKDTFGGVEKFTKAVQTDSVGALKKFADALKNVQSPAGGLQGSVGKLFDELIRGGRALSSPVIPLITKDIKSLTLALQDGTPVLEKWGTKIANIYKTISDFSRDLKKGNQSFEKDLGFKQDDLFAPPGLSQKELDASEKRFRNFVKKFPALQKYFSPFTSAEQLKNEKSSNLDASNVLNNLAFDPDKFAEQQAKQIEETRKAIELAERNRQGELDKVDAYYKQIQSVRESAFSIEVAQNQNNVEKVFQLTQSNYEKQLGEIANFYDKKIALQDGDTKEIFKLEIERNNALRELDAKRRVDQINFEREQNQKRRQIYLEFKQLQEREVSSSFDKQIFETERAISLQYGVNKQGYDQLIDLTSRQQNIISRIISDQFASRLQDETLTAQQVINLTKERDLTLTDLAEKNRRAILDIEDRRHSQYIDNLISENERTSNLLKQRGQLFSDFQNTFLKNSLSFGDGFKQFGLGILGTTEEIAIGEKINAVLSGRTSIYDAQKDALASAHKTEQDNIQREIDLNTVLIGIERTRQNQQISQQIYKYQDAIKKAQEASAPAEEIAKLQAELNKLNLITVKNIDEQSPAIQSYTKKIEDAGAALKQLQLNQAGQKQDLFEQSTEGAKKLYEAISNGSKDAIFGQIAENNLWKEKVDLLAQNKFLQLEIASSAALGELRAQREELEYIAQNTTTAAEAMTEFKLTIADGFFQQINQPFEKLKSALDGLPPILKGITSAFLDMANAALKAVTQAAMLKFLGIGGGQGGGGFGSVLNGIFGGGVGGTPSFNPNSGGSGNILSSIFGGGGGLFSKGAKGVQGLIGLGSLGGSAMASTALGGGLAAHGAAAAPAAAGGIGGLGALSAFFTNPWTIGIGAGIVGGLALWKIFGGQSAEKKLKKAADVAFGVKISDRNVLKQLKQIGEGTFGRGQAGKKANEVVQLEMSKDVISDYAESTGQSSDKVEGESAFDPLNPRNIYNSQRASASQIANSFTSPVSSSPVISLPNSGGTKAEVNNLLMGAVVELIETVKALRAESPGKILMMGDAENPDLIPNSYQKGLVNNPWQTEAQLRNTGQV